MLEEIKLIRERTRQFAELAAAHHFLFDLPLCEVPLPSDFRCEFVIMGINPGEAKDEWDRHPGPTEETSDYDFHAQEKGRGRSSKRWRNLCIDILQTDQCILTEFFFWCSRNGEQFE